MLQFYLENYAGIQVISFLMFISSMLAFFYDASTAFKSLGIFLRSIYAAAILNMIVLTFLGDTSAPATLVNQQITPMMQTSYTAEQKNMIAELAIQAAKDDEITYSELFYLTNMHEGFVADNLAVEKMKRGPLSPLIQSTAEQLASAEAEPQTSKNKLLESLIR